MPIETTSEKWENGKRIDWMEVYVSQILSNNPQMAYTVDEITDQLIEDHPEVIPKTLQGDSPDAKAGRESLVSSVLATMEWLNRVEWRVVEDDLHYTCSTDGNYPVADTVDVFPARFSSIEDKLDKITDKLDEETYNLHNRMEEIERRVDRLS